MWYRIARRTLVANSSSVPMMGTEPPSTDALFFHTTSLRAIPSILSNAALSGGPFVSLAAGQPIYNDIRANRPFAVIAFQRDKLAENLLEVQYNDNWYNQHNDHAAYIAGEGWREQYEEPEDAYDQDGWADDEYLTDDYDRAQREAFWSKSEEKEWVGKDEGDLPFNPNTDIAFIQVDDKAARDWLKRELTGMGLSVPITVG